MINKNKNIENFLKSISSQPVEGKLVFSFAFEFSDLNFYNIIDRLKSLSFEYFYTSTPSDDFKFLGVDSILTISEQGNSRVQETSKKILEMNLSVLNNFEEVGLSSVPLFLGGMKFSPDSDETIWNEFSDSEWFIPKLLFYKSAGKTFVIYNTITEHPGSEYFYEHEALLDECVSSTESKTFKNECKVVRSDQNNLEQKEIWIKQVESALEQIKAGKFHKIVLSRQVTTELSCYPNFSRIVQELESKYPKCYIFAFRKNDSTFFGASPEKLAKISNGWVEADALAGSIGRGSTEQEDIILENELLSSKKNLNEQKAVVEFIVNSFDDFSEEIIYESEPIIRKLPNIQHLWTPIKARLKGNKSILSILKDIHPTPAICGVPWNNALISIKEMEIHSRGLFAGMIGWFNFKNEGEFAVAIRSALAKGKCIYALAGCGIVEGSDPEQEYNEAELKLRPILTLFQNEEIYQP